MSDIMEKDERELQEAIVEVRKKRIKKKVISTAIVSALVLATIVMVWIYGHNSGKNSVSAKAAEEIAAAQAEAKAWENKYNELVNVPVVLEPVTPEIVQKVLSSKIVEISELATAEYIFTNADKFQDTAHVAKVLDWMTKKAFVQKWDGKIKAGVKVDNLQINIEDNVITITMPAAEILSYEIDYDSVEVLDEKNNIFNQITIADKAKFDKETKESMVNRAIENGLLEKAQKNAENVILNLVTGTIENIQEYKIEFVIDAE